MKRTIILGTLAGILVAGLAACNNGNGGYSNQPTQPLPPPGSQTGMKAGQSQSISKNGARIDSAADDVELKSAGPYNPNDHTHVINPSVKPNETGYSADEAYQFVDGANDKLMELLRNRADNRTRSGVIDKSMDPGNYDDLRADDLELARSITMAEMRRAEKGNFEFHIWTQNGDEIILTSPYVDDLGGPNQVKTKKMPLEAQEGDEYKYSTAQCLTRDSDKEKICQTVLLRLAKGANEAWIVFRHSPARIVLGEYSSRLLTTAHQDPIVDRWVEFFHDALTDQVRRRGAFNDALSVSELKTFAVVNGIAAFTLSLDRSQRGKFIVSGDMVTGHNNSSEKLNIPLQRGILAGTEDQPIDYISETVSDASILHANGRGMMEISVQLKGGANSGNDLGSDEGGIIFNRKGVDQSRARNGRYSAEMFYSNMRNRFSFARQRTKSMRLQEKSNRAIRFTVVPVLSSVVDPDLK